MPPVNTSIKNNPVTKKRLGAALAFSLLLHFLISSQLPLSYTNSDEITSKKTLSVSFQVLPPTIFSKKTSHNRIDRVERIDRHDLNSHDPQAQENKVHLGPSDVDSAAHALVVPQLPLPSDIDTPNGTIRIKLYINELGLVDFTEIDFSTLPSSYADLLTATFKRTIFQPATKDGKTVSSWALFEITLEDQIESTQNTQ